MAVVPAIRTLTFDMGISHADFTRLLPAALGAGDTVANGNVIVHRADGRSIQIELSPQQTRKLAALELPTTGVRVRLEGFSDAEAEGFLSRFHLAFRKGGG